MMTMDASSYTAIRQARIKEVLREQRKASGYSQQTLADLLSCARSRISDIEDPEKTSCYTIGELELLAGLFGVHPFDVLRQSGEETIAQGEILTEKQTGAALLDLVDCMLPEHVVKLYTQSPHPTETPAYTPDAPIGGHYRNAP